MQTIIPINKIKSSQCIVPTHMEIKGNEEVDRAAKEAINIARSDHKKTTLYSWPSGGWETPNGKGNVKKVIAYYTTSNQALKTGRVL